MVLGTISRQVSEISLDFHKMENVFSAVYSNEDSRHSCLVLDLNLDSSVVCITASDICSLGSCIGDLSINYFKELSLPIWILCVKMNKY